MPQLGQYSPEEAQALLGPEPALGTYTPEQAAVLLPPERPGDVTRGALPGAIDVMPATPEMDAYIAQSGIGRVLNAFGQGAASGWGAGNLGLSPESEEALRRAGVLPDVQRGQGGPIRALNEALIRPAAAGLDAAARAFSAAIGGIEAGVEQTGREAGLPRLGREAAALLEYGSIGGSHPGATPAPQPVDLQAARSLGVIGEPERVWRGFEDPRSPANENVASVPRPVEAGEPPAAPGAPESPTAVDIPGAVPEAPPADIHGLARQIAPDTFSEYDELTAHREMLRGQIAEQQATLQRSAEAQAPHAAEIQDLEDRLEDTTPRLAKKYQVRLEALRPARDAFLEDDFQMAALTRDTPEIAALRQQLLETDFRMRDLAPDVTEAYRQTAERMPPAPTTEAAGAAIPEMAEPLSGGGAEPKAAGETPPPPTPPFVDRQELARALGRVESDHANSPQSIMDPSSYGDWTDAMEGVPRDQQARFQVHGTRDIWDLLAKGIDPDRPFHSGNPIGDAAGGGVLATRTDNPFLVLSDRDKNVRDTGVRTIVLNGAAGTLRDRLSTTFPSVRFLTPAEAAAEMRDTGAGELPSVAAPTPALAKPPAAPRAPEAQATTPTRAPVPDIAADVARKLRAAGRPAEEAEAGAQVTAALWRTRAAAFEGRKGTAEELYAREAPDIRPAPATTARARVIAQSGSEPRKGPQGRIRLTEDGQAVITLMRTANASTYLHEMGHDWLERMMRDAADPDAPGQMKADAATVRAYLRLNEGDAIPTRAHEKFARSFERYFMEGRAPSQALASVFAQFRQWLTTIYQSAAALRAPITADIRDVFDRLLTRDPDARLVPDAPGELPTAEPPPPSKPTPLFPKLPKEPTRLVAFLRQLGGVRDDGGDVAHILGGARYRPGLINSAGRTLDDAARLAWEHGYFPDHGENRPSINDLLEAIEDDLKGTPRYSGYDRNAVEDYRAAIEHNAEVDRLAHDHDIDTTGMTRQDFFEALSKRVSEEQLYEDLRSFEEAHEASFGELAAEAREWADSRHDDTGDDHLFGIEQPRDEEELEHAYESENAARPAGQSVPGQPEPAAPERSSGDGEEGGGPSGRSAGDPGRPRPEAGGAGEVGSLPGAARAGGTEPLSASEPFGRPDDGLIDRAGNIRLDRLGQPEDVNQIIRDAAGARDDFLPERRGAVSDADVLALADTLGMAPADLNRRHIGEAFNAEQVVAARRLLIQSARAVREAMDRAADGNDAEVLAYAEARERHLMIQGQVAGITAEAGRALRAFRQLEGERDAKAIGDFLQGSTGRTLNQLRSEAKAGALLETPAQVSKFTRDMARPSAWDMAFEYWVNGLISNPATHMTYAVGNTLLALWKAGPERAAAAGIGMVRQLAGATGDRVYFGEAGAELYGLVKGQRDGIRAAYRAARTGLTEMLPGETQGTAQGSFLAAQPRPQGAIPGAIGAIVRLPSRGVATIHSYYRAIGYSQSLSGLAYRQAAAESLVGDAFAARVAELQASPPEPMMAAAREAATQQTLMGNGGAFTRAVADLINTPIAGIPLLKLIDPFVRISSNVMRQALLERSPLGAFDGTIRANLMGRNGAIARDEQIARIVVGTALGAAAIGLANEGYLTGGGPTDPKERAVWMLTGKAPYSVRIGDTWYEAHRLGPLAMILGVAADMQEFADHVGVDDGSKLAANLVTALSHGLLNETFMRGPADLMQALENPQEYGTRYVNGQLQTVLPFSSAMRQAARAMDPYLREARTTMDSIRASVPLLSTTLMPRNDIFGRPIPNKEDVGFTGLTSIAESRVNGDPVVQAMQRLRIFPAMPERRIAGVVLSDAQYEAYSRIAGLNAKQRLDALVAQPGFSTLPDGVQTRVITETIAHARQTAAELVKMQNPGIIQQAIENKRALLLNGRPQ